MGSIEEFIEEELNRVRMSHNNYYNNEGSYNSIADARIQNSNKDETISLLESIAKADIIDSADANNISIERYNKAIEELGNVAKESESEIDFDIDF